MLESERRQRNQSRLQELYPYVRTRIEAVVQELEAAGYRPRIQEAWRSVADQLKAYNAGTSRTTYGFHNVTAANGQKEALAADILDDNRPLNTRTDFMLRLAAAAEKHGLTTGIRWGLSDIHSKAIDAAIAAQTWTAPIHVGWDPLHVEVTGLPIGEARLGKRPDTGESSNLAQNTSGSVLENEDTTPKPAKRQFKVEEIETGCVVEYSLGNPLRPVTLLPVPYVSQLGEGAEVRSNDCGAACAVMLMRAYQKSSITPNQFYVQYNIPGDPYLSVNQVRAALNSQGILTDFRAGLSIPDLFNLMASGKPAVVLIRYKVLFEAGLTEKPFQGPHFAVVVGVDPKYIYIHDPLYSDPLVGEAHPYPLDTFWQAWKAVAADPSFPNPERSAIIPVMGIGFQVSRMVKINISSLNVRTGPGLNMPVAGAVKKGEIYPISREVNGWGEIGLNQWIKLSYTVAG
jgi:hypothetical protein